MLRRAANTQLWASSGRGERVRVGLAARSCLSTPRLDLGLGRVRWASTSPSKDKVNKHSDPASGVAYSTPEAPNKVTQIKFKKAQEPQSTAIPEVKVQSEHFSNENIAVRNKISETLKAAMTREEYELAFDAFEEAQRLNIELVSEDYNLLLRACAEVKITRRVAKIADYSYQFFARTKIIPLEVFMK
jgi:hypothetical protein